MSENKVKGDEPQEPSEPQEEAAPSAPPEMTDLPIIGSVTVSRLDPERRPNPSTVCQICPASLWFTTPKEVKCFCRIMHVISWSTAEPQPVTDCDGYMEAIAEQSN